MFYCLLNKLIYRTEIIAYVSNKTFLRFSYYYSLLQHVSFLFPETRPMRILTKLLFSRRRKYTSSPSRRRKYTCSYSSNYCSATEKKKAVAKQHFNYTGRAFQLNEKAIHVTIGQRLKSLYIAVFIYL